MLTHSSTVGTTIAAGLAIGALVAAQQFGVVPGGGRVAGGIQNAAHGPWFALLIICVYLTLRRHLDTRGALRASAIAAAMLALGTEGLQYFTGGDPEWRDVLFDGIGAVAALVYIAGRTGLLGASSSKVIAAALLLVSLTPAMVAAGMQGHRNAIFPQLTAFDMPWRYGLLNTNSDIALIDAPPGWRDGPARVLSVALADVTWPGITLPEPVPDWSAFDTLEVDVFTPAVLAINVSIRLRDASVDHVYRTFALAPGVHRLALPIRAMFDAANTRVSQVGIYSTRAYAGQVVYLGDVRLRP